MKKLLLSTAVAGLAFSAVPAHADIDLGLGGFFNGYAAYVNQDDTTGEADKFGYAKNTELHISGETTLDNGLTVGAHGEFNIDGNDNASILEESYAYFSGSWGRVNFGEEDGAAYLLQVAAPSADSNVDGIRTYIDGVNKTVLVDGTLAVASTGATLALANNGLDYNQNPTGYVTKATYLSPVVSGFQAGVSFTPDVANIATEEGGVGTDNVANAFGNAYELALRYEGEFEGVGVIAGAGYSMLELEQVSTVAVAAGTPLFTDDRQVWNVGLDLNFGPFGVGAIYKEDDNGEIDADHTVGGGAKVDDEKTFVIGADYTTGPFKLGASYIDVKNLDAVDNLDADRYTGGVVYTYGPGMTLRGSVSYVEYELTDIGGTGDNSVDGTEFLIGTKVKF